MARPAILTALVLLGIPGAVSAQEAPTAPPAGPSRDRLPILGTVGDYPPQAERVVAEISPGTDGAPPRLVVEGRQLDLKDFTALLGERSRQFREEEGLKLSRLHVVIRADRDVRWQDTQWVMQACADPSVRINRILFAAVPEDGSEEGAVATYLPADLGVLRKDGDAFPETRLPVLLRSGDSGPWDPGDALLSHLERLPRVLQEEKLTAVVDADPEVATGTVLETVDALLRWGAKGVLFRGTTIGRGSGVRAGTGRVPSGNPRITVFNAVVAARSPGTASPRPLARVRGRLAGQAEPPPAVVTETPPLKEGTPVSTGGDHVSGGIFSTRRGHHADPVRGGDRVTEDAILAGLEWLKTHQSPDGRWDCDGFEALCGDHGNCGGPGSRMHDVGVTGLAVLAFLGYGETHKTPRYGQVVRSALKYLKGAQDAEGCFASRANPKFIYDHALAALAMAEAFGLTQSPLFKSSAQNGVNFAMQSRNPGLAWGYGVESSGDRSVATQDNDTSVTGWMVLALRVAQRAGLDVDPACFTGAKAFLDTVTDPETGRTGYTKSDNGPDRPQELIDRFPAEKSEAPTAVAVLTRILCGAGPEDEAVRKGAVLCLRTLPRRDDPEAVDFVYWHFGTLAMFQMGGDNWATWNVAMKEAVLATQRQKGTGGASGSWDPADPWASEGGRVYSTALNVMDLEVYYRYARMQK